MRRGARRTIERGIYLDEAGYEVVARAGKRSRSKRFPADEALKNLRAWRDGTASELRDERQPTTDTRTLSGSIARYKQIATLKSAPELAALSAWQQLHGDLERRRLTPALAAQAMEQWKGQGYSPQSLYYRRLVIVKVWRTLDGPKTRTPVDDLHVRRPKARRAVWVSDETINQVLLELLKHEAKGISRLRNAKTRARFLVLASTGQRPAQLKRAKPEDVDLEQGTWWVRSAKGGEPTLVFLNDDMRAAWQLFIYAKAWGHYDSRSFVRTLRRCGWPAGVRPYAVRHATGLTLRARGADLGDIQDHLGHTSMTTTRIYAAPVMERAQRVSEALAGRFGWARKKANKTPT